MRVLKLSNNSNKKGFLFKFSESIYSISIKLDCDDHCTTANVINSLSNINK